MYKILVALIMMNLYSCKEKKVVNKIENDDLENAHIGPIIPEIQVVADLFKPERMEQDEIENKTGKNNYKYTITNSDLLDTDLKNTKIYAEQIVDNYYNFLIRINKPFNYDKIIVEIRHRNGKIDIFKYSEIEMKEILGKRVEKLNKNK